MLQLVQSSKAPWQAFISTDMFQSVIFAGTIDLLIDDLYDNISEQQEIGSHAEDD